MSNNLLSSLLANYRDHSFLEDNLDRLDLETRDNFMSFVSSLGSFYLIDGEYIFLDKFIDKAVLHLNSIGVKTIYSCNGHSDELPYISIKGICIDIVGFDDYEISIHANKNFTVLRPRYSTLSEISVLHKFINKILSLQGGDFTWS